MPYTGYQYETGPTQPRQGQPYSGAAYEGGQPPAGFAAQTYGTGGGGGAIDPQLQAFLDLYNTAVMGPSQAIGNQQVGNLQDQMAFIMAGGDLQSSLAQQQADYSLAGLGLQQQDLGVREGALARQAGLLPQQFALQNQGFDLASEQANYGAGMSRRQLDNSYTARGAFTSEGANQGRTDIQTQLDQALRGIGLQREGARLSNEEQMAQLSDARKQLSLSSKQLGLSEQDIRARLTNALQQIGLSSQMDVNQLLQEMYKVQQGQISPISGLFGDIYALSGVTMPTGTSISGSTSQQPKVYREDAMTGAR